MMRHKNQVPTEFSLDISKRILKKFSYTKEFCLHDFIDHAQKHEATAGAVGAFLYRECIDKKSIVACEIHKSDSWPNLRAARHYKLLDEDLLMRRIDKPKSTKPHPLQLALDAIARKRMWKQQMPGVRAS